jgi:hypothetical protein
MFVSNKAGKGSSERETGFITHDSIKCSSSLPFIALLLDLNGDPKLEVSFPKKEPNHTKTDRCLRIYASGVGDATFPFLATSQPRVKAVLAGLISKPKEPSSTERLQALVKYGSTDEVSHMRWEAQSQHVQ